MQLIFSVDYLGLFTCKHIWKHIWQLREHLSSVLEKLQAIY